VKYNSGQDGVRAEKPADWCHRGQVAGWLHDQLGIEVFEFGHEDAGHGWQHPKLFRRSFAQ
jgi:hypothetical protein